MDNNPKTAPGGEKKKLTPYLLLGVLALLVVALIIGVCLLASRLIDKYNAEGEYEQDGDFLLEEPYETVSPDYGKVQDYWEGDWYGWWIIGAASESWEDQVGNYLDACARIRFTGENTATVTIWDEERELSEPLCTAEVTFDGGAEPIGCMVAQSGKFMGSNMEYADWVVDPALKDGVGDFRNMIFISGFYLDPEKEEEGFEYNFFLRPWGMDWEDVRTGDTSECAYDPMMPACYDDWYYPLIQGGVKTAPERFYE